MYSPLYFVYRKKSSLEAISGYTYLGQTVLNLNHKISKEILFSPLFEVVQLNKLRRIEPCCRITVKEL